MDSGFCWRSCLAPQRGSEAALLCVLLLLPEQDHQKSSMTSDARSSGLFPVCSCSLPYHGNRHFCPSHHPLAVLDLRLPFYLRLLHELFFLSLLLLPKAWRWPFALLLFYKLYLEDCINLHVPDYHPCAYSSQTPSLPLKCHS